MCFGTGFADLRVSNKRPYATPPFRGQTVQPVGRRMDIITIHQKKARLFTSWVGNCPDAGGEGVCVCVVYRVRHLRPTLRRLGAPTLTGVQIMIVANVITGQATLIRFAEFEYLVGLPWRRNGLTAHCCVAQIAEAAYSKFSRFRLYPVAVDVSRNSSSQAVL